MAFYCMGGMPFEVQARYASAPFIKKEVISAEYSTVQQYATLFTVRYLEITEVLIGQQWRFGELFIIFFFT